MWTIIKVDKKKLGFLKSDFTKILEMEWKYTPQPFWLKK